MARIINDEEFVTAVRKVIAERGDGFRYEAPHGTGQCRYVSGGSPSCLYGAVLFGEFGLQYDPNVEGEPIQKLIREAEGYFAVSFTLSEPVIRAAYESQRTQDTGSAYDVVRDEFDALAAGYEWSQLDGSAVDDEGQPVDRSLWASPQPGAQS